MIVRITLPTKFDDDEVLSCLDTLIKSDDLDKCTCGEVIAVRLRHEANDDPGESRADRLWREGWDRYGDAIEQARQRGSKEYS